MHPFLDTQRCHVGVVFALAIEADAFESRGRDILEIRPDGFLIREGTVADRRVAWVVGGTGIEKASAATQMLIDGHRPQFILSGICRSTRCRHRPGQRCNCLAGRSHE